MSGKRTPAFVVPTPFPDTPQVVCYNDTWSKHIPVGRRTDPGTLQYVTNTLTTPSAVCVGTTNPAYIVFVNHALVSPGSGSPFVVVVDPQGKPMPALASFSYRRQFKDLNEHSVLWLPSRQIATP